MGAEPDAEARTPAVANGPEPGPGQGVERAITQEVEHDGQGSINGSGPNPVTSLFLQAHERGRLDDGIAILKAASQLRPAFDGDGTSSRAPSVIPLSRGASPPGLYCVPSIVPTGGPHEYARFAQGIEPARQIVAVPVPGFDSDELLPASVEAVAAVQAEAVASHASSEEVVLVGYSTGGLLAYAAACRCLELGLRPSVVLIDTYFVEAAPMLLRAACDRMVQPEGAVVTLNDARLTATGAYLRLLTGWRPRDHDLPTLLVRASDQVSGLPTDDGWQAGWTLQHTLVSVPGDHFTIMQDCGDVTAQTVERWLEQSGLVNLRAQRR